MVFSRDHHDIAAEALFAKCLRRGIAGCADARQQDPRLAGRDFFISPSRRSDVFARHSSLDEGKVSVANSTCRIVDGDEGYVKVKLAEWPDWQAVLRLSDASGYVEGTGSSANWLPETFFSSSSQKTATRFMAP